MESQRNKENGLIEDITGQIHINFSHLNLSPLSVRITKVKFDLLKKYIEEWSIDEIVSFYLCAEEREQFFSFRYEKRKTEWLSGRIAAKCAAIQLENNEPRTFWEKNKWHAVRITSDRLGKPYVSVIGHGQLAHSPQISISHSKELAIGLAALENCGVDIQKITPAIERVENRFVALEEHHILAEVIELYGRQTALTLLWSAKEAVKKAAAGPGIPGFMGIRLCSLQKQDGGFLFSVSVKENGSWQKTKLLIWVCVLESFSFAMTTENLGKT
ncbi:MAG: 4'-phosphopantetheinyl transferase superfamily protein [Deltaproteobacteria bacterium]|nr:4'-phosphopantetheinyl transferase superfamily protein [Deltaproteobacteria bacterium]